jgi:tetratricopeptide (TPR) repeat protein
MLRCVEAVVLAWAAGAFAGAQDQALREAARLDAEGKCDQAEPYYRQALAAGTPSAALLNNAGNHYLVCGQAEKARLHFEALLKLNPAHQNANLQLARIATERRQGAVALGYLAKVTDPAPAVSLLRAEAMHAAGKTAAAAGVLEAVQKGAKNDPRVLFTLGVSAARLGLFERAEAAFGAVAAQTPGNFDVLLNLGRAASRAGHYERAASALEVAVKLRPRDTAAWLELGRAHAGRGDHSRAVYVLAQARAGAPQDPEILYALAHAAEDAGFYGDAALAYDEYLALRPGDDRARRDRGHVCALTGSRLAEGRKEMEWYIGKHPSDPVGLFNLAQFTWAGEPERTLDLLSRALRADPGFAPAHFARAWLLQRSGRMEESLPHLEATVRIVPNNVRALDQLGLAYLSLERPAEAEKTLRKALALDARDREVVMHLGQALLALDREGEARQCFEEFRKLPARQVRDPRSEAGMIELATLPVAEQTRRAVDRLRRQAGEHPDQPELQLRLAQLLLSEGRWEEAEAAFRELGSRNADSRIWEEAGTSLLRAERYEAAIDFLKRAVPARPAAFLELAIALSFTAGPQEALEVLEQAPEPERAGDYQLLKARLLDACGRKTEAEQALQAGLRLSASRPQVAQQAALVLLGQDRRGEALALVEQALRAAPASADLALMRAVVLGLLGRVPAAETALREIQSRWPEWDRPYLAHGLLLEEAGRKTEARRKLETARALNPQEAGAPCRPAVLRQLLFPDCGGTR